MDFKTEREKMLAGELYSPADKELHPLHPGGALYQSLGADTSYTDKIAVSE